jgi:hypothetical protein
MNTRKQKSEKKYPTHPCDAPKSEPYELSRCVTLFCRCVTSDVGSWSSLRLPPDTHTRTVMRKTSNSAFWKVSSSVTTWISFRRVSFPFESQSEKLSPRPKFLLDPPPPTHTHTHSLPYDIVHGSTFLDPVCKVRLTCQNPDGEGSAIGVHSP